MKAIRVEKFGGPEVLQVAEVPDPQPAAGQLLIRVHAAGINPVDTYIRGGKYPRLPELPYTPGTDGAGRVESAGEGSSFTAGERVYLAGSLTGTCAELCLCQPEQVHPLPESISFAQGAALGVPYATAYRALFQRAKARAGETVLIHGGTGGVGLAAIQWALGAGLKVFASGGTEEGRQLMRQQGAHEVLDHHAADFAEQIREKTDGHGVHVIVEMLANVNLGKDLCLLAQHGRIAVVGSRGPVEINPREAMAREADIYGVMLASAAPEELAEAHRAIGEGLRGGTLRPVVAKQFPLSEAPGADAAAMAAGSRGKIVLTL